MYDVKAVRWAHGWELHIGDIGVTQSHTLADAESMVRDFLALDGYADAATAKISITPDLDGLEDEAHRAAENTARAAAAQRLAAAESREVVRKLRNSGLSVTDTAAIMGVSRGRVSQLAKA